MDPLCHTLVGASLGQTGLEKRTKYGLATLIIGANLPDIDAITYFIDPILSIELRRGCSHGILALLVLPFLLAGVMKLFANWRLKGNKKSAPFKQLLLLSAIGVASHPSLDFLNNYGMRWLMPFVDEWFYGDTLFIIDPYVWAVLAIGLIATRFAYQTNNSFFKKITPSTIALLLLVFYIGANYWGTQVAENVAHEALQHELKHSHEISSSQQPLMASPVQLTPHKRQIVADNGREYLFGKVTLLPTPTFTLEKERITIGEHPAIEKASQTKTGEVFLHWARFPFYEVDETASEFTVYMMDARYIRERDSRFAMAIISIPKNPPK